MGLRPRHLRPRGPDGPGPPRAAGRAQEQPPTVPPPGAPPAVRVRVRPVRPVADAVRHLRQDVHPGGSRGGRRDRAHEARRLGRSVEFGVVGGVSDVVGVEVAEEHQGRCWWRCGEG